MHTPRVAVIDTGLHSGSHNAAVDRAGIESAAAGCGGDMLRWYRNRPTVSIGLHQALDREVRQEYCTTHDIEIVRRPTGGGALYLDPGQLCFSLILTREAAQRARTLASWLESGSRALAAALATIGIPAAYKFPNDVEVGGRKIASAFAVRRGDAVLLQGVVLLEADVATMLKVLRVPTEKLSADGLAAARERLIDVSACAASEWTVEMLKSAGLAALADEFALSPDDGAAAPHHAGDMSPHPRALSWGDGGHKIEALTKTPGGSLRVRADFDGDDAQLRGVEFATDGQVDPADFFSTLATALDGVPVQSVGVHVEAHAERHALQAVGIGARDITLLLQQLADKRRFARQCGLDAIRANALMPYTLDAGHDPAVVLQKATVMLVPYCAKPAWCKWRHRDGCTECGLCEVGAAYAAARARNMQVTTVTHYEHLVETLAGMKTRGVEAYVGMCCSHFFLKRHRAFAEAGMPALLIDISGANCYELRQEELAYAGSFEAEARLDAELVEHVMRFVPRRER